MKRVAVAFLLAFLFAAPAPSAAEGPPRLGVTPFYAPEKIWTLYAPFVDFLRQRTGDPWELHVYADHDALVAAVLAGEVSVSLLGPVPAARVMRRSQARPVAVALAESGKPVYTSVIVTSDPAVLSLKDVKGKTFGFFKGSTAAHLMPMKMLADARIATTELRLLPFSGQDRLVEGLFRRDISAAGIKESLYHRYEGKGLRKLAVSPPVPNFAFYSSPSLSPAREKRFLSALLSLSPRSNDSDRRVAAPWDDEVKNGFVAPPAGFRDSVIDLGKAFESLGR